MITPIRLRVESNRAIGTTAFFRNRPLFRLLLDEMKLQGNTHYKILFHACSIGAEVYSFVIMFLAEGYDKYFTIEIEATDLEADFINHAKNAIYPADILKAINKKELKYFTDEGGEAKIKPKVKNYINFLEPYNYLDFSATQHYNSVFLLNTLIYVPCEMQSVAIDKIANYNNGHLITTAFHMNDIKSDLNRNRYYPVKKKLPIIHDAWTDRRVSNMGNEKRTGIYADWTLPQFSKITDYEYKYCSLFRKKSKN